MGVVLDTKNRCFVLKKYCGQKATQRYIWKIRRIQIQIYPLTSIDPKYSVFYLTNKVMVHGLVLLVQLTWEVASPSWGFLCCSLSYRINVVWFSWCCFLCYSQCCPIEMFPFGNLFVWHVSCYEQLACGLWTRFSWTY